MYKAKNGLIIYDNTTAEGWSIEGAQDLKNALLSFPLFQTVHEHALWLAIDQATKDRKEFRDIKDFAQFIAQNYI